MFTSVTRIEEVRTEKDFDLVNPFCSIHCMLWWSVLDLTFDEPPQFSKLWSLAAWADAASHLIPSWSDPGFLNPQLKLSFVPSFLSHIWFSQRVTLIRFYVKGHICFFFLNKLLMTHQQSFDVSGPDAAAELKAGTFPACWVSLTCDIQDFAWWKLTSLGT